MLNRHIISEFPIVSLSKRVLRRNSCYGNNFNFIKYENWQDSPWNRGWSEPGYDLLFLNTLLNYISQLITWAGWLPYQQNRKKTAKLTVRLIYCRVTRRWCNFFLRRCCMQEANRYQCLCVAAPASIPSALGHSFLICTLPLPWTRLGLPQEFHIFCVCTGKCNVNWRSVRTENIIMNDHAIKKS